MSLAVFVFTFAGVFLSVVSLVALFKIIQIADDLRYIRSLKDSNTPRPKGARYTIIICVVVALVVALAFAYAAGFVMTGSTGLANSIANPKL